MRAQWILPLMEAVLKGCLRHLVLVILVLVGAVVLDKAQAEEISTFKPMSSQATTQSVASDGRESFLQQFISRSLTAAPPAQTPPALPPEEPQARPKPPPPPVPPPVPPSAPPQVRVVKSSPGKGLSSELTAAATKMILALAAILSVLIGAAYLVRRFVINRTPYGSSEALLRVAAKVPLSAKSMVALIEVPGKCILVGVSGATLTPLGETGPLSDAVKSSAVTDLDKVATPSDVEPELETEIDIGAETDTATLSFAESLKQYAQNQVKPDEPGDKLLSVEEVIQKKVSNLKRL